MARILVEGESVTCLEMHSCPDADDPSCQGPCDRSFSHVCLTEPLPKGYAVCPHVLEPAPAGEVGSEDAVMPSVWKVALGNFVQGGRLAGAPVPPGAWSSQVGVPDSLPTGPSRARS